MNFYYTLRRQFQREVTDAENIAAYRCRIESGEQLGRYCNDVDYTKPITGVVTNEYIREYCSL